MTNLTIQDEGIREIIEDHSRGAAELAQRCLEILAIAARRSRVNSVDGLITAVSDLAIELHKCRPSMAPIRNLLSAWMDELADIPRESLTRARKYAAKTAETLRDQSAQAAGEIARHARALIGDNKTIFSHSLSSVVVRIFETMQDLHPRAIVTESRPLCEGRMLAEKLIHGGIPVTYITEAQAGLFIDKADCVLVGADTILADGSVINKAGTYLLALAAADGRVPFYVACESFKFDFAQTGDARLEEMSGMELGVPSIPGLTPRNIYFDVTPRRLITAWITEQGVLREF